MPDETWHKPPWARSTATENALLRKIQSTTPLITAQIWRRERQNIAEKPPKSLNRNKNGERWRLRYAGDRLAGRKRRQDNRPVGHESESPNAPKRVGDRRVGFIYPVFNIDIIPLIDSLKGSKAGRSSASAR